jgi:hypothetical protein
MILFVLRAHERRASKIGGGRSVQHRRDSTSSRRPDTPVPSHFPAKSHPNNRLVITRTMGAVVNPGFTGNEIEEQKGQSKDDKVE